MGYEPKHAWRYHAKCMETALPSTNLFYPPRERRLYRGVADAAKSICWGTGEHDPECPVRRECLAYAVEREDTHGIWGGMSHRERSHLLRKFAQLSPDTTFQQWIMESDGGLKAKQFIKQVPRRQEGTLPADRES